MKQCFYVVDIYIFEGQKVEKTNKKQLHCVGPFAAFCTSKKCSHH